MSGTADDEHVSAQIPSTTGLIARVIGWLRAGYPAGVPEQDYVPLLGILQRSLTSAEVAQVVDELIGDSARSDMTGDRLDPSQMRERIEQLLLGPALPDDLVRVSARLASAGWPLGFPEESDAGEAGRSGLITRVVRWLREGYPAGLPEQDFVPLIALLRRRLTDAEVTAVGSRLAAAGDTLTSRVDVGTAIARVTSELPSDDDVDRVRRYLVENGWPEEFPV
ncbi:hypothetical protein GCM10027413_13070 [Conyzicola nivalis]|uniref:DUF3349 domain-containing protein n=1 Tax=Conyzicola nivalis TaxID=1477021 RepID=A0A916WHI1_9MICO|nr:DUF3349 domain-containing protein [Conyzicola nivalis]GGB00389.1 hypothetical protein GCM10010979_13560 [Conyzicola nivalis]